MPGGSESTTDLICGRRETVEKCGEQPQEPRRKCVRRERSQGEKERNGSQGRRSEKKATLCTWSSTSQLQTQQPSSRSSNSSLSRQPLYPAIGASLLSGFRVNSNLKSEALALTEFMSGSAKKLTVEPSATVGL